MTAHMGKLPRDEERLAKWRRGEADDDAGCEKRLEGQMAALRACEVEEWRLKAARGCLENGEVLVIVFQ